MDVVLRLNDRIHLFLCGPLGHSPLACDDYYDHGDNNGRSDSDDVLCCYDDHGAHHHSDHSVLPDGDHVVARVGRNGYRNDLCYHGPYRYHNNSHDGKILSVFCSLFSFRFYDDHGDRTADPVVRSGCLDELRNGHRDGRTDCNLCEHRSRGVLSVRRAGPDFHIRHILHTLRTLSVRGPHSLHDLRSLLNELPQYPNP